MGTSFNISLNSAKNGGGTGDPGDIDNRIVTVRQARLIPMRRIISDCEDADGRSGDAMVPVGRRDADGDVHA